MILIEEEWRTIENFSRYQVSSFGRVKALAYTYTDSRGFEFHTHERILSTKPFLRNGKVDYVRVKLVGDDAKVYDLYVHRLVAIAFLPNPNNLPEVNHIDLDKSNNKLDNLEWVTRQENMERCIQSPHKGETNGNSKLTKEIVQWCRNKRATGCTYKSMSDKILADYGISVTPEQVSNVVNYHWQHI